MLKHIRKFARADLWIAAIFALVLFLGQLFAPQLLWAKDPPFALPPRAELSKLRSAVVSTSKGELFFELFPDDAPWHVANFKYLADKGWYKNKRFDYFYSGQLIQGGAPLNDRGGGPGYSLPPEFNRHQHKRGTLGMGRAPNEINPGRRSNGSQFYIMLGSNSAMDGSYTPFGQLRKGFATLDKLGKGDAILDVKVYVREK